MLAAKLAHLALPVVLGALFLPALSAFPAASALSAQSPDPPPIMDNSFLIEEAYNQEAGVVQHISTFSRATGGSWLYNFTQEWPLTGVRHQLSYTIPLVHDDGTGLGDVQLNYRLQVVGDADAAVALAPRLTAVLPTGSSARSRGTGSVGVQIALPASFHPVPQLVFHLNGALTWLPDAKTPAGASATNLNYNLGASAIWLARSRLNLLVEWIWQDLETTVGKDATGRSTSMFLNPGIRLGFDTKGGLQIVPGLGYTVGIGPSSGDNAWFLYLSFEHPFGGRRD